MDLTLNYNNTKAFVNEHGIEEFIKTMEDEYNGDFFSCSMDWLDSREYICKLKGGKMDLIIRWG